MTTKQDIIRLLETNDKAVARALVVLNERQTADERSQENTKYHNGRGFTPADAFMGTKLANFYLERGYLTTKQIAYFRKPNVRGVMRIAKYAGQLLEVAAEKAERMMQQMEAAADREGTARDETNKVEAKAAMETGSYATGAAKANGLIRVNGEFHRERAANNSLDYESVAQS